MATMVPGQHSRGALFPPWYTLLPPSRVHLPAHHGAWGTYPAWCLLYTPSMVREVLTQHGPRGVNPAGYPGYTSGCIYTTRAIPQGAYTPPGYVPQGALPTPGYVPQVHYQHPGYTSRDAYTPPGLYLSGCIYTTRV